ncbi:uncharacterized protein LOC134782644 [Penaeus indicus]|uniref:uncharacterized protein LOC134782644 n=1 Tax=Penaeus indicus TaxID=29960 RepID=UPI00300C6492
MRMTLAKLKSRLFGTPCSHVRVNFIGKEQERYFSPVSRAQVRDSRAVDSAFSGSLARPSGVPGPLRRLRVRGESEMTLLASGGGIGPGMQLIRAVMHNPDDRTKIKLLYFSENYDKILFRDELDRYRPTAKDSRLHILHTLGESPEDWEGEEGFIDTQMINKHVTKPNDLRQMIITCGGPTMVLSCLYSPRSLCFPCDAIFIYRQFGAEYVRKVYGRNVQLTGHRSLWLTLTDPY